MNRKRLYNGWTNYNTWLVNLWLDNDGSKDYWREVAEETTLTPQGLAEAIQESIEENIPESGLFADLLNAAMQEVNWLEIAESIEE